jgi:hypothetical protein
MTTTIQFSGVNHTACVLDPSSSGPSLPSLPVDFTTVLPAQLWPGNFYPLSPPSIVSVHWGTPLKTAEEVCELPPGQRISKRDLSRY